MNAGPETIRPAWPIDHRLTRLLGQPVRVAAEAFTPPRTSGSALPQMIPTARLILPDNSTPDGLPVYFEGRLEGHLRRVGVVEVTLGPPPWPWDLPQGITPFRGSTAVILPGPALVRLAFPFVVEPVPADEPNYWRDLRLPGAQLELTW